MINFQNDSEIFLIHSGTSYFFKAHDCLLDVSDKNRIISRMPNILRIGPYRFFFYSADLGEPIHAHISRDDSVVKFWINPVRLASNIGFSAIELRKIERLVEENQMQIERKWNEFFTDS
jgi:hypothetical protein